MQNMVHILYLYSLASCMYDSDFHAWEQGEGGGVYYACGVASQQCSTPKNIPPDIFIQSLCSDGDL
jgi:hypothetical protein